MKTKLYNLTNPQKSIYLTEQYYSNTNVNNICGTAIIEEKIDFNILEKAINLVIENNDSFNLHFKKEENSLKQYITDYSFVKIDLINLNSKKQVKNLEQTLLNNLFDLNNKLYEFKMFKFPEGNGGFLLNIHHIISDAWTLGLTCRKIMEAYSILISNGNKNSIKKFSYIDYINEETKYLESEKFKSDETYWNTTFSTSTNSISVPSLSNLSNSFSCIANRENFVIPRKQINLLKKFCKINNLSLFNLFMSIVSIFLYKINNINDFVIGTPILNRTNFNEKNTTGMFINVAPFRVTIPENINFLDFTHKISRDTMGLLRHQRYPYQYILENLRKKDINIPNLYNIVLSYQITRANNESDYTYSTRWAFNGTCLNDIDIQIYDLDETGNLNITYDYKKDKYTKKEIKNIHDKILYILNQFIANPNKLVNDIDIILPKEKEKILNINHFEKYNTKNFIEIFEKNVKNSPNSIAIIDGENKFTYSELNSLANKIAHFLQEKNVQQKSIVAVSMERNYYLIASILGILKLGCSYLPIFPEYPFERINYILKDCNYSYFLTDYENNFKNSSNIKTINFNNYNTSNLNTKINLDDLAYIIYTSGSTGKPKGVMLKHSNLLNFLHCFNNNFKNKFSSNDKCLSLTNISFDVSICEIFTPLMFGCTLVLYPENTLTNIPLLCNILNKHKITFLYLPPSLILSTYNFIENNFIKVYINKMLVGVEPIKNKTLNNFYNLNNNIEIINGYGPTETTICCTFFKHTKTSKKLENEIVPIGKPLANNTLLILDNNLNLVPLNSFGEIYLSGKNVSKGYLNNPDLTEKSFVKINNNIFYKTGDLAKIKSDGNIEFKGRNDSQIKFKGNRIELNEINLNIQKVPGVNNCITIIQNINKIDYLCSYITTNTTITSEQIKKYLKDILPHYMIPTHIVILDKIPLTPNGKIDKKSLPPITINEKITNLPVTETEKFISAFLTNILSISSIDILENFLNIGVDSLMAIQLISEIYSKLNKKIFIQDVFKNPTIYELSKFIDNIQEDKNKILISPAEKSEFYPATSAQKRIFYSVAMSKSDVYNIIGGIEFEGKLDLNKVQYCFDILIKRHESLRTSFLFKNGELVQKINNNVNSKVIYIENTNLKEIIEKLNNDFDFEKAPLAKMSVAKLEKNKFIILICMHHIISDGTSINIFTNEFCKLYYDQELEPINLTYKDYAIFEKNAFSNNYYQKSKNYWINKFKSEIPVLNLPTTYNRPPVFTYKGSKYKTTISKSLSKKVYEFCNQNSLTPFMLFISTYYILLNKYSNNQNILVGTPVANREFSNIQNIIGMFVNTIVLDAHIDNETTFLDFCLQTKENSINSFKYQNYSFDELIHNIPLKRDLSRNMMFDAMFIYQNNGMAKFDGTNFKNYFLPDNNISKFDLSLEILPNNDIFDLNIEYCTDLFSNKYISKFAKHFIELLKNAISEPGKQLKDLSIISKQEKNYILNELNDTTLEYDKTTNIAKLFKEQASNTPNKIAVIFEDKKLTYLELDSLSTNLANYLLNIGIKAGDIVGIMLNRSLEMLVCMIGILKIGATYLPIDPTYPKHRIKYILDNSNSKLILTEPNVQKKFDIDTKMINVKLSNSKIYNKENNKELKFEFSNSNLCYIIYTSGSTGNPKGVMLTHKNVVNLINGVNKRFNFNKNYNFVSLTTICFDIFVIESLYPLCTGHTTVITNEEEQNIPKFLNEICTKNDVKILQTTPSRLMLLLNDESSLKFIENLKYIIMGGEAVPTNLVKKLKSLTKAKLINGYGPTETTVYTSFKDLSNTDEINIGTPVANTHVYVLDNNMNLLPVGIPGNLFIGGDAVGNGYLNREDLTKEKFIDNPFIPGTKMYNSGDIVKLQENGDIFYIGRSDFQVKLHGLRIELGEIEKKISGFENVTNAAVTVKTDKNNREILCGYFTSDIQISIKKLKNYLRNTLPEYMIPRYFEQLSSFTYTPNGKIDRKSLPNPQFLKNKEEIIKPETQTEKLVLELVESILSISPISITDNIFDIGADSLTALRLQIELLNKNINIPYSDIFKYNTIKELSLRIDSNSKPKISPDTNNYDYTAIHNLISTNTSKCLNTLKKSEFKNIILTGATGFLGAHILSELLDNYNIKIYCLVRNANNGTTITEKLKRRLNYYFGKKYDKEFEKRIILIESDISDNNLGISKSDYELISSNANCIINSAANVKHYGYYSDFEKINVIGVQNLINFAIKNNMKFVQISTDSISGNTLVGEDSKLNNFNKEINYTETSFFAGQSFENVYVQSKFEAEKLVFKNILENSLDGLVLRVGYITPRYSDGKFQINKSDNAYINRLKTFGKIGYIPEDIASLPLEFTPVDSLSKAIIKAIEYHNKSINVLHLYNPNHIIIKELINIIYENFPIVSSESFKTIVKNIIKDSKQRNLLSSIINDMDSDFNLIYSSDIKLKNDFTVKFLEKVGFKWPKITDEYINKIKYLL